MVEQHRRTCQASLVSNCVIRAGFRTLHGDLETTIAQRMGNDWYEVGRRLEVADWELENIQADYPTQYRRACRVLQKWKHHRGEDATPEHLHSTLLDCRRTDLAGT